MKKTILSTAMALLFCFSAYSTVHTVSNLGGAQFSNLTDVYNAASDGDTIYIEPTEISYGNLNGVNKKLTWVGIGGIPATDDVHRSIVDIMTIDSGASGSSFFGIYFLDRLSTIASSAPTSNLFIENCLIGRYIDFDNGPVLNTVVRNCIFLSTSQRTMYFHNASSPAAKSTVTVTNCFISQLFEGYSNPHNIIVVDHCLIYPSFSGFTNSLNGALIKNSYFTGAANNSTAPGSNNVFLNNIIRGGFNVSVGVANSGSGNQFNSSMTFVNYNGYLPWSYLHNYNLQPGSNGIGDATDGTDIGIHGGNSNFSNSTETLWIPIVRSLNFQGDPIPLVQPGDTLQITIEASQPQMN
jgi:hypothetical protein